MISETTNDKKKTVEKPGIGVIRYRFKNNSIRYIQGDTRQAWEIWQRTRFCKKFKNVVYDQKL